MKSLKDYDFPEVSKVDLAFGTFNTTPELLEIADTYKDLSKGKKKFNELFFEGGSLDIKDDVEGTWKENALLFAISLKGSFAPKHQHKEKVCAMIFQECLIL